jgi:hypothetical protein
VLTGDLLLETGVMAGVSVVEGGPEDGDRAPAFTHGGLVRCLVDACGEAREDDEAPTYELGGDLGGKRAAFVGSAARAHNSDAWAVEEADVSGRVEGAPSWERDGRAGDVLAGRGERDGH